MPRPERATTASGEHSRARLLESAIELIAERGYAATGVGAVCERAGMAKTALYWHFGSKEGLLAAVVEQVGGHWIEEIQKSACQIGDPLERVERLIDGWRAILLEQPQRLRLLLVVLLERGDASAPTREALRRVWERAEAALVQGIEDSVDRPLPDLDLVAHTALTLLHGILMRRLLDPEGTDVERLFDEFRRTLTLTIAHRLGPGNADVR